MDKELSPEADAALRAIVREMGTVGDLDENGREELYAHLEDKTLAYLAGDVTLSEADAVVLARNHFGSANTISKVRSQAFLPVRWMAFVRLIIVIAILDLAMGVTFSLLRGSDFMLSLVGLSGMYSDGMALFVMLLIFGAGLYIANRTLWKLQHVTRNSHKPGYLRWKLHWLAVVLCVLLILRWLIPGREDLFGLPGLSFDRLPSGVQWLALAIAILWAGTWVRSIHCTRRGFTAFATCAAAWIALRLSFTASRSLLGWLSPYLNGNGDLAWRYIPGRLFKEPNDFLSMSKSVTHTVWENGALPLAFIISIVILYLVLHHLFRAIRMYMRSCRNDRQSIPWAID